jgi:hypothetical protein
MGARSPHYCDEDMLERLPAALNIAVAQIYDLGRITERAKPQLLPSEAMPGRNDKR